MSYVRPYFECYSTDRWDISLHGDDLERRESTFILSMIPAYAQIWERFIGRQPDGAAAELLFSSTSSSFDPAGFQLTRLRYAQHHYSILASFDGMRRGMEETLSPSIDDAIDSVMLFHAYMGRVRDALKRAGDTIGVAEEMPRLEWWRKIQAVYAQRSVIIHGPHPPLLYNGYEFKIFGPADGFDDHTGLWSDATQFTSLLDYYDARIKELIPLAQSGLSTFLGQIVSQMRDYGLYLEQPAWYETPRYGRSGVAGLPQPNGIAGGYGIGSHST